MVASYRVSLPFSSGLVSDSYSPLWCMIVLFAIGLASDGPSAALGFPLIRIMRWSSSPSCATRGVWFPRHGFPGVGFPSPLLALAIWALLFELVLALPIVPFPSASGDLAFATALSFASTSLARARDVSLVYRALEAGITLSKL